MKRISLISVITWLALALVIPGLALATNTNAAPSPVSSPSSTHKWGWPLLGFDPAHTGSDPHETILSPSSVGGLGLAWSRSTGRRGYILGGSPLVTRSGQVIVPGADAHIHAFDAATGSASWTSAIQSTSLADAVGGKLVYVGTSAGLSALKTSSGRVVWSDHHPESPCVDQEVEAPPNVADGVVYAALNDPELVAVEARHGECVWASPAKMGFVQESSPAVENGAVYAGDDGGQLFAIDASDGSVLWHVAASSSGDVSTPVVAGRRVYATSADEVGAYKVSTGARIWAFRLGRSETPAAPAFANGVLYVGSNDGMVYALNSKGDVLWGTSLGAASSVSVSLANGVVYVSADALYALDAATGSILWSGAIGNSAETAFGSTPAIVDGMVYVEGNQGRLYAFGLPDA
jgi:outer membrane protein assembly factor BamB